MLKICELSVINVRKPLLNKYISFVLITNKTVSTWVKIFELKTILTMLYINRKAHNYFLDLPIGNQRTRSRQPVQHKKK